MTVRPMNARERGQALVEFAIALPIVVVLALALFDGGRLVIDYTTLTNASRVGARVAMVNQSNSASCGSVRTFKCAAAEHSGAMGIAPAAIPNVVITGTDCEARGGCAVTVTVDHAFQMITPVISSLIGNVNLSASTTMPMERAFATP